MDIDILVGKTIEHISDLYKGSDEVTFICSDGTRYRMYHSQDCCEQVNIEDMNGEAEDLLDSPIVLATKTSNNKPIDGQTEDLESTFLWTFYRIATIHGTVCLRWYGASDYYSLGVSFEEVT